jgi:hypothetical protein
MSHGVAVLMIEDLELIWQKADRYIAPVISVRDFYDDGSWRIWPDI